MKHEQEEVEDDENIKMSVLAISSYSSEPAVSRWFEEKCLPRCCTPTKRSNNTRGLIGSSL